jgi:hypothetical protein
MRLITMLLMGLLLTAGFCGCDDNKDQDTIDEYNKKRPNGLEPIEGPIDKEKSVQFDKKINEIGNDIHSVFGEKIEDSPAVLASIQRSLRVQNTMNLRKVASTLMLVAMENKGIFPDSLEDIIKAELVNPKEILVVRRCDLPSGGTVQVDIGSSPDAESKEPETAKEPKPAPPLVYVAGGVSMMKIDKSQYATYVLVYSPVALTDGMKLVATFDGNVEEISEIDLAARLSNQAKVGK